ncbi:hypothetical protein C2W62_12405 [Candidatus Entotheonella serta]|nr:hypothetical protein C2W62_12405 [Candidatus Entotheonella serta]
MAILGGSTVSASTAEREIPSQIPDFSPLVHDVFGVEANFFTALEADPFVDSGLPFALGDASTINDFCGSLGLMEATGVSRNNSYGERLRWFCDIRYLSGVFVNRRGQIQFGTFGYF